MKAVSFSKMVAAGNDFVVIDNRRHFLPRNLKKMAQVLSDRKHSIGADGLLILEKSKRCSVRMRLFNPDGSEAEMCGNGVRCLAKFAVDQKITKLKHSVETLAGLVSVEVFGDTVKAVMVEPKDLKLNLPINVNGQCWNFHFINTGVPHAINFVENLEDCDVKNIGQRIRSHEIFAPKGANVNFVFMDSKHRLHVRTYERGVEDETLACGTGSTASALVAALVKGAQSPVSVCTKSGEVLKIYFEKDGSKFSHVILEGKIKKTFEGRILL